MCWTSKHIQWLINTGETLKEENGRNIEVQEFQHQNDEKVLSEWAKHFRNHYCSDNEIDYFREGSGLSRSEYLNSIIFPDPKSAPGPSIRSGDFSEILVADYLEYVLGLWVPRTMRYANKAVRNESTKGVDVIGIKLVGSVDRPKMDVLYIYEVKAQFSGNKADPRLQNAIDDSAKDQVRKAESLNAFCQRFFDKGQFGEADKIKRFQNPVDRPYTEISGAAALFESGLYDKDDIELSDGSHHPNEGNLKLIVIRGDFMMNLVHELYTRAANEA